MHIIFVCNSKCAWMTLNKVWSNNGLIFAVILSIFKNLCLIKLSNKGNGMLSLSLVLLSLMLTLIKSIYDS